MDNDETMRQAWDILNRGEEEWLVLSMARERAAYGEYLPPETPAEYLDWILDEATLKYYSGEAEYKMGAVDIACGMYTDSASLRDIAIDLLLRGITPTPPRKQH